MVEDALLEAHPRWALRMGSRSHRAEVNDCFFAS